jgi:carboxypeptidase Q
MRLPKSSHGLALALGIVFGAVLGCRASAPSAPESALSLTPAPSAAPTLDARGAHAARAVARIVELGRTDNRVQEHLEHLARRIGPRLSGSRNLQRAVEWTAAEFERLGLRVALEEWGEVAVGFERGPWRGGMVAPEKLEFEFNTFAWTAGTKGPARGRAVQAPTTEGALEGLESQLGGAWVVYPPAGATQLAAGVSAKLERAMESAGALGAVRGARGELLVTDGNWRVAWDDLPTLPVVRVRAEPFAALWKRLEAGEAVELEFDIDNRFVEGPIAQHNVVADLVGVERPDEYVIVGGHLDSWDGAEGAVDNATGVATTLEAARLLVEAGARPARTIRFVLWTGEEQGLHGSRAYVKQHAAELERISAVLNHDGGTNYLAGLRGTKAMEAQLREACAPLFGLDPQLPFEIESTLDFEARSSSDHWPYVELGVPGFFWMQAGRSNYTHHHHTQHDTFEAAIPEYQRHSAMVAAIAALGIADLPELLERSFVKPIAPRRMGVQLEGVTVSQVSRGGKAAGAGWKGGDRILAIDGVEVSSREAVTEQLQVGGPRKTVLLARGEERIESVLDYSDDPLEGERAARRAAREGSAK